MINLDDLENFLQLHENINIIYLVDGYRATLYTKDGNAEVTSAEGTNIIEALINLKNKMVRSGLLDVYEMRERAKTEEKLKQKGFIDIEYRT